MDVKPIPTHPGFMVSATGQAREERQQRERDSRERSEKKKDPDPAQLANPTTGNATPTSEISDAPPPGGQMIDSEKVLELLAHRPASRNHCEAFKKLAVLKSDDKTRSIPFTDGKKLGKSF